MTLATYERRLTSEPGHIRFTAARPAFALRQALRNGESFDAARDRLLTSPPVLTALRQTGHLAAFRNLTLS